MNINLHAVVLAGGSDFGRCAVSKQMPICLWPAIDTPVIIKILQWLETYGIRSATVCFDGDYTCIKKVISEQQLKISVDFLDESLPWGTGGCFRESAKAHSECDTFLVCKASMLAPPALDTFISSHFVSEKLMTIAVNPASRMKNDSYEVAGTYLINREALQWLPELGYCDIKERLIPSLIKSNIQINSFFLERTTGTFRDLQSYTKAVSFILNNIIKEIVPSHFKESGNHIYTSEYAEISDKARLIGPLIISDNVRIETGCIISGPGIISNGSVIGNNSVIDSSIIWDHVTINQNSMIRHCFINKNSVISSGSNLTQEAVY